jgi:hypothetical protein
MKKHIFIQCLDGKICTAAIHPNITEPFFLAMDPDEMEDFSKTPVEEAIHELGDGLTVALDSGDSGKAYREFSDDVFLLPNRFLGQCYIKFIVQWDKKDIPPQKELDI